MYGYVATSEDDIGYVTVPQTYACQGGVFKPNVLKVLKLWGVL